MAKKLGKEIRERVLRNMFVKNYKRIWPYLKPYWVRGLLAILVAIPVGSLDAVIALALKPYMDVVMIDKNLQTAWYIPLLIIGFTLVQGVLKYIADYLNTWVGTNTTNLLKKDLYRKMLTFETEFFNKKNSGEVLFMFNSNADMACAGLLNNVKAFVQKFFTAISLIAVLFYNSWQLALVCVAIMFFALLPMTVVRRKIKNVVKKSIQVSSELLTEYNETYNGNKTIISYNLAEKQRDKFDKVLNNSFSLSMKMMKRTRWLTPVMHVILSVGIGLAIWFGSYLILNGSITAGSFVSFLTALIMLYTPIKSIGGTYNSVLMSFLAIERVFDILDAVPAITEKKGAVKMKSNIKKIEYRDVSFEYVKDVPVLKNINFTVKKGETIAFVGNSGGGKSTVVSLLPRFYDVTSGAILIDGVDVRDMTLNSLRANIGVVFQDNFLFSGTIRENIMLGNEKASEKELLKAVKMACLDDVIKTLPDGLDSEIGERGVLLSGGQKQRVAIARAFLKNAPILVLDEATSALDNKSEAVVQKAIENLMKDKTVFVIAHRLSTIQNADNILVINDGQVVESGTHEELIKNKNGAYKTLYDMQFKAKQKQKKAE